MNSLQTVMATDFTSLSIKDIVHMYVVQALFMQYNKTEHKPSLS